MLYGLTVRGRSACGVHWMFSVCAADAQSPCEVGHSSCSHQVAQEEFLGTDVMHHLEGDIKISDK